MLEITFENGGAYQDIQAAKVLGVSAFDFATTVNKQIKKALACSIEVMYNAESIYLQCSRCSRCYTEISQIPNTCSFWIDNANKSRDLAQKAAVKILEHSKNLEPNWTRPSAEEYERLAIGLFTASERCDLGSEVEGWPKSRPLQCLLIKGHVGECKFTILPKQM